MISPALRKKGLSYLKAMLGDKTPPLRLVLYDGETFDFLDRIDVVVTFTTEQLWQCFLRGDFARLADAYVCGELIVEGTPRDIVEAGVHLCSAFETTSIGAWIRPIVSLAHRRRTIDRDVANVRYHYDVSNEFYRLWLDDRMVYSCAYFENGAEDIERAQQQKLDHLCRKLMLNPGDRLLDIGCGWGALMGWAAERYGVAAVGITISEQQFDEAQIRLSHLGAKAKVQKRHYQQLSGQTQFDRIASVGMYEHVGTRELPAYFNKIAELLEPGGVFLNHGVISPGAFEQGPSGGSFIERYVFPGGAIASLATLIKEISSVGLEIIDIEDLRPHYALTLKRWSERLEQNQQLAIKIAGAPTYRIWRVYLAGMAYAFDRGWLSVAQVLALKPTDGWPASRPWTRAHQYRP